MVVFEVGVGPIETCRSRPYWNKAHCVLFEPSPFYDGIVRAVGNRPNVQVHKIAVHDYNGTCNFIVNSQLSAIAGLSSPQVQFGVRGGQHVSCQCAKISEFDKGDIDLLLLDMEGAEWFALKHLISRPKDIIVETQLNNAYKNPFLKEIKHWMKQNQYRAVKHVGADTIWQKTIKVL